MKTLFYLPFALILLVGSCTSEQQENLEKSISDTKNSKDVPFITCIKKCQCPDETWSQKCDVCSYQGFCSKPTVCECKEEEDITTDTTIVYTKMSYVNQEELETVVRELYKGNLSRSLIINHYDIFIELFENGFMGHPDELINKLAN